MHSLSEYPITQRWPPRHPDRLQLYSMPTPNGLKISFMLEETGLPHESHRIDILANETHTPEFLTLNPNGKIPAILDPNGPDGTPFSLFESGAILLYLAEKTGKFLPTETERRYETLQWVFFQMASVGPMFGQLAFFHKFGGRDFEDKRPRGRYAVETKRLLNVLENHLARRGPYMMGEDCTIADFSLIGWVRNVNGLYEAGDLVSYSSLRHVPEWLDRCLSRPAIANVLASLA